MNRNETCSYIFKLKSVFLCKINILGKRKMCAQTEIKTKSLVVKQVMQ